CKEVVGEAERKSVIDTVDVEHLPMTAFERSRPIWPIRWSRLAARRARCNAEQAEGRHGGDAAEKAAACCNAGFILINIPHLFLHRVLDARRYVVVLHTIPIYTSGLEFAR